jgi:uncharacterized membrane protein
VVGLNHHLTTLGKHNLVAVSPTLRFVFFGALFYPVSGVFLALLSNFWTGPSLQFTHAWYGYQVIAIYGFFSMIAFGAIYYIVPRLARCEWLSVRLIRNHFWFSVYGICTIVVTSLVAALYSLVAVYAVSLASELMGTGWGVPFGPYSYTSLLGPKWFELVPVLIPLSWFTMSWACWTMSRQHRSGVIAIMLATVLLVSWDLLLDPAMSKVTSYWVWGEAGSYYGMPWMNLFGWGVTGLVLFVVLNLLVARPQTSLRFAMWVYGVNFALPLGFCILNQYCIAVGAGVGGLVLGLFAGGVSLSANDRVGYSAKNAHLQNL